MQHQSQDLSKRPTAGKTGIMIADMVIGSDDIERHIAEGKRMQAEAIAAFLTGAYRWVGTLFQRQGTTETTAGISQVRNEHLSRA